MNSYLKQGQQINNQLRGAPSQPQTQFKVKSHQVKQDYDNDDDGFDFSDTDEGILKEGPNNFKHKKMMNQHELIPVTTMEHTQFQQSLQQQTQFSMTQNNQRSASPQKQQLDIRPEKLSAFGQSNTIDYANQQQNSKVFQDKSNGYQNHTFDKTLAKQSQISNLLVGSKSQSFLHSKRNTTEIGNNTDQSKFLINYNQNQTISHPENIHHQHNKSYQPEADFRKAYKKLEQQMKVTSSLLAPVAQTQRQGQKFDHQGKTFDRQSQSYGNGNQNSHQNDKKFNVNEFIQKNIDFEEKKKQRLVQLQEQQELQDLEQCTFEPNKHRSQSGNRNGKRQNQHRNPEQFLEDQAKKEEERQIRLNMQAEMIMAKQQEQLKAAPRINDKSKKLLEKQKLQRPQQNEIEVHQRLYAQNNKQKLQQVLLANQDMGRNTEKSQFEGSISQNTNLSFRPKIHKKSQLIKRDKPIEDHLYDDAKMRKQKKENKIQEASIQEQYALQMMSSKQLSANSEKYFIQKFTKEIIRQWQTLPLDEISQSNETLNYLIYKEFMVRLGFMAEKHLSTSQRENDSLDQEKSIVYDLWKYLGGEVYSHITLNNLRIFLLAIMGTYLEPGLNKNEQELRKVPGTLYGEFNSSGDLFLELNEISLIQKEFHQLYLNRTQFESKQRTLRKQDMMNLQEFEFKPTVNNISKDIALKYREKLEEVCQAKLTSIDWLIQPAKNPKWQETAKEIVEQEQLKECTFKPEVSTYRRDSNRGKSQELMQNFNKRKDSSQSAVKIRSRELMPNSGNKFNDLFELSKKLLPKKEKMDKSNADYEFERMKDELTFHPQIIQSQENSYFKNPNQSMITSKSVTNIRGSQQTIQRLQKARDEKEQLRLLNESGRHRNESQSNRKASPHRNQSESRQQSTTVKPKKFNKGNISMLSSSANDKIEYAQSNQKYQDHDTRTNDLQGTRQLDPSTFDEYLGVNKESSRTQSVKEPFPTTPNEEKIPMLYVDINLGQGNMERVVVFPGNSALDLANDFAKRHNLDNDTKQKLKDLLDQQIQNVALNGIQ